MSGKAGAGDWDHEGDEVVEEEIGTALADGGQGAVAASNSTAGKRAGTHIEEGVLSGEVTQGRKQTPHPLSPPMIYALQDDVAHAIDDSDTQEPERKTKAEPTEAIAPSPSTTS